MSFDPNAKVTHRSVLVVALPIMLSNVSEPLIGVVNTAVIGQLKEPYYIGAIAVGALVFSFLFWGFGFLRLSTGGLSAQALGAGDRTELVAVLIRALMIAVTAGAGLILLSPLIRDAAFNLVGGSAEIRQHGELVRARRPATCRKPVEEALRQAHVCPSLTWDARTRNSTRCPSTQMPG